MEQVSAWQLLKKLLVTTRVLLLLSANQMKVQHLIFIYQFKLFILSLRQLLQL